jgi:hypothetical protein
MIFSQALFGKNLMNSAKSSTLFQCMSCPDPHFLWALQLKWQSGIKKAGIHLME